MGQQLKAKMVVFEKPQIDSFDSECWLESISIFTLPLFYFLEHGRVLPQETHQNDCSYLHPYFQIRETRVEENCSVDEMMEAESEELDMSLADRDVDWKEHDALERQFDLENEAGADGFVIITLPKSILSLTPWDTPRENEEEMLWGFDLTASNIPRTPITCQYSRYS